MTEHVRARAWLLVLVIAFVAGAVREKLQGGIERLYLLFGLLLLAPLLRRFLSLGGRASPPTWVQAALEVSAFAGLVSYPMPDWALTFAGLAGIAAGLTDARAMAEPARARWPEELCVVGAAGVFGLALARTGGVGLWWGWPVVMVLLAIEAWSPGADRRAEIVGRRVAAFVMATVPMVLVGYDYPRSAAPLHPDVVFPVMLTVLGLASALAAPERATSCLASEPTTS